MQKDMTTVSLKLIKQFFIFGYSREPELGSGSRYITTFSFDGKISISHMFQSDKIEFQGYP